MSQNVDRTEKYNATFKTAHFLNGVWCVKQQNTQTGDQVCRNQDLFVADLCVCVCLCVYICVCSRVCFQDKKKVACRHDWHQTENNVVVTIYAKNANPDMSCIEANQTVVSASLTPPSSSVSATGACLSSWNYLHIYYLSLLQ